MASDEQRSKVKLFRSFDPDPDAQSDVPDPYYEGGFDEVFEIVDRTCQAILDSISE